jgi:hypothetical protein
MLIKFVIVFLLIICVSALPVLFFIKAGLQLQYQNIKSKKPEGNLLDFWVFDWKSSEAREQRVDAFLLFPIFFPIDLEESNNRLVEIKHQIRTVHLVFYALMIILILLGSYISRAYPEGFF